VQEFYDLLVPTWSLPDEEKKAARQKLVAPGGPLRIKLQKLSDMLVRPAGVTRASNLASP
jgi:hypothetical protein